MLGHPSHPRSQSYRRTPQPEEMSLPLESNICVDIELSEFAVFWKDQRPFWISVETLHGLYQGEFFSDRFREFFGKLLEPVKI
jgi:hypothetical protein